MLKDLNNTVQAGLDKLEQLNTYEQLLLNLSQTYQQIEGESTLSRSTVEDRLIAHFLAEWGDETVVVQENEIPVWLNDESKASEIHEWTRITVRITTNAHDSFGYVGNRRMQRTGRVYVQLFVKTGIKTSRINELTAKVIDIYENIVFSRLRILEITEAFLSNGAGESVSASSKTDGVWFGKLVNVLFQFDEVK